MFVFQIVRNPSLEARNFSECPESVPDVPETFQSYWQLYKVKGKFSRVFRNLQNRTKSFPEGPETFIVFLFF